MKNTIIKIILSPYTTVKTILKFSFGVTRRGVWEFSMKRTGFTLATITAYIVPHFLLKHGIINGAMWLDFYKVVFPSSVGVYVVGKFVDKKKEE